MLAVDMAPKSRTTKRASSRTKPTAPQPDPTRADGRVKSKLTMAREAAALAAGRALLLATLKAEGWNLTATAETLGLAGVSQVLRAIRDHGLDEEHEAARIRGDIRPGPRPKS